LKGTKDILIALFCLLLSLLTENSLPWVSMVYEKIAALRLPMECNESNFALLEKGPSVLNLKGMEEELENIQNIKISQ
jgi:hypothetical protein